MLISLVMLGSDHVSKYQTGTGSTLSLIENFLYPVEQLSEFPNKNNIGGASGRQAEMPTSERAVGRDESHPRRRKGWLGCRA